MKALFINGSPRKKSNTARLLEAELQEYDRGCIYGLNYNSGFSEEGY